MSFGVTGFVVGRNSDTR